MRKFFREFALLAFICFGILSFAARACLAARKQSMSLTTSLLSLSTSRHKLRSSRTPGKHNDKRLHAPLAQADLQPIEEEAVTVREATGKGLGLFAVTDIPEVGNRQVAVRGFGCWWVVVEEAMAGTGMVMLMTFFLHFFFVFCRHLACANARGSF